MYKNFKQNLKQMARVGIDRTPERQKQHESFSYTVNVDFSDRSMIKNYMTQELNLYNALVDTFSPCCISFAESFMQMEEQHFMMFAELTANQVDINALDVNNLPKFLQPYEKILKEELTDKIKIIFEVARTNSAISKNVRRNMAYEVIKYYQKQAKSYLTKIVSEREDANSYKVPPEPLSKADILQKRHLQVPRSEVIVEWNDEAGKTLIKIPYAKHPLEIPTVNVLERGEWNILILHQQTGVIPLSNTPWVCDFKTTLAKYILKYLDIGDSRRATTFYQDNKRSY